MRGANRIDGLMLAGTMVSYGLIFAYLFLDNFLILRVFSFGLWSIFQGDCSKNI